MRHNRLDAKNKPLALKRVSPGHGAARERQETSPAESLHHVFEDSVSGLSPGDIIVLDGSECLRSQVESDFFAVLACPQCGTLDLITPSQYFGGVPVICGSNLCSCRFRIDDESRLVYLPVN